jgi:hypothetical protein
MFAAQFLVGDPSWPTNPTVNAVFTVGAALPLLLGLWLALRVYRTEHNTLGFVCILGGALASMIEPLVTYVGYVHYPAGGISTFSGFGETIPLFVTLAYAAEIGLGSFAVWRLLVAGGGAKAVLKVWWCVLVADIVLETPALWLHVFYYYGPRPLNLWGFPLYWAPMDATLAILPGVLLFLLWHRRWNVWHHLVTLLWYPANVMIVYLGAGWPIFSLQHAAVSEVWLWVVSPLTLGMSYLMARSFAALSTLPPDAVKAVRRAVWPGRSAAREREKV